MQELGHAPLRGDMLRNRRRLSFPYIAPYHRFAAGYSLPVDNVGDQSVMMSSHFLQVKPSTTALSPSVTVTPDVARSVPDSPVLRQNEEVGT